MGDALAADRSLGGLAEGLDWGAPKTSGLAIDGAASLRGATVPVTIHYASDDPLGIKDSDHGQDARFGADCVLLAAFEASYGVLPADGYGRLSFKESSLGAERPLGYDPLLGQGRDAQDPFYEAVKDEGDIGVPLDVRALGFWLKGLFGAPATSFALKRFSQGSGTIRVGGGQLAGGKLSFSNNLERVETIRADGLIDGVDETEATAEGSVDIRFGTDTTLTAASLADIVAVRSAG